jgi:preprotein translocase subunit SecG
MPLLISLTTTLNLAQILISVMLSVILLLQAKGSGFGASLGGSTSSVFRTRRGVEKTLFQLTIILVVIFLFISLWSVRAA